MHRSHLTLVLSALAFLSGVSGIAYEVLYVRLISAYVGNIFYVGAALLAIFFMGIALGSLIARRYVAFLRYIEIGIGLYAIGLALIFAGLGLSITQWVAGIPGPDQLTLPLFVFLVLALPAIGIGFSLPLFAVYIEHYRRESETFNSTYAVYNLGAAVSVIAIEYLLIWNLGISISIYLIASINILIGICLYFVQAPPIPKQDTVKKLLSELDYQHRSGLIVLGLISIISGIAQLNLFNLSYNIIGPHNENFALLIGVTLLAISVSAVLVKFTRLSLRHSLASIAVLGLVPFLFFHQIMEIHTELYVAAESSVILRVLSRLFVLGSFMLPVFIAFGTTIPTVVKQTGIRFAGLALSISAGGNALGYLAFLFLIHDYWMHLSVIVACSLVAAAIFLSLQFDSSPKSAYALCLMVVMLSALANLLCPAGQLRASFRRRSARPPCSTSMYRSAAPVH